MILIIGKRGQLAQSLAEMPWQEEVAILGSDVLDLADPRPLGPRLDTLVRNPPRLVFNAAAYTAVDKAESEPQLAFRVNAEAVGELGAWTKEVGSRLIHFSTDYVYSGAGTQPATENDPTEPLNTYGRSKLRGEELLLSANPLAYNFRISWIVSPFGSNFVKTMLRLGKERNELKIVADQVGSPMSALAIARLMHRCFDRNTNLPQGLPGIYNLSSAPYVSWFQFAGAIFKEAKAQSPEAKVPSLVPIPTSEYVTPAKRPLNSRMSDQKFRSQFNDGLGNWETDLKEIIRRLQ